MNEPITPGLPVNIEDSFTGGPEELSELKQHEAPFFLPEFNAIATRMSRMNVVVAKE